MDVEEVAASMPERLRRAPVDIARGLDLESARAMLDGLDLGAGEASAAEASAAETAAAETAVVGRPRRALPRVPRQRRRAAGGQPSRPARGRAAGRARLQVHPGRFRHRAPGGAGGKGQSGAVDRARSTRKGAGAEVHRTRRRRRGARQRRRAHHDHDGRGDAPRGAAGELPGDRRRGVHQGETGAGAGARQPSGEVPGGELLRRVRAHRRDDRRGARRLGKRSPRPFRSSSACTARARPRRGRCSANVSG